MESNADCMHCGAEFNPYECADASVTAEMYGHRASVKCKECGKRTEIRTITEYQSVKPID